MPSTVFLVDYNGQLQQGTGTTGDDPVPTGWVGKRFHVARVSRTSDGISLSTDQGFETGVNFIYAAIDNPELLWLQIDIIDGGVATRYVTNQCKPWEIVSRFDWHDTLLVPWRKYQVNGRWDGLYITYLGPSDTPRSNYQTEPEVTITVELVNDNLTTTVKPSTATSSTILPGERLRWQLADSHFAPNNQINMLSVNKLASERLEFIRSEINRNPSGSLDAYFVITNVPGYWINVHPEGGPGPGNTTGPYLDTNATGVYVRNSMDGNYQEGGGSFNPHPNDAAGGYGLTYRIYRENPIKWTIRAYAPKNPL